MKKRWRYLNQEVEPSRELQSLTELNPIILQIMANRQITSSRQAKLFLQPELASGPESEQIPNIAAAAQFILKNIQDDKQITIYGDYDVDGITSTSLYYLALQELGARRLNYYLPHRFTEGYGLNKEAIAELKKRGTELIITADCGISNYEEIQLAKELGLSVVVTDHHLPPVIFPKADYIVNPKTDNRLTRIRDLAGVGVSFMLAEELFRQKGVAPYSQSKKYLDLVALGTIADIVPLLGENRTLAVLGLERINRQPRLGIRALAEMAGQQGPIDTKSVGYGLAPRLNAAGRMEHATLSVELLLAKELGAAKKMARELNEMNLRRQEAGNRIKTDIEEQIRKIPDLDQKKNLIFSSSNWHPGIVGIVASQIAKQYNRPTVLIAENNGEGRGSVRSFEGLNIFEPLSKCAYLLKDFGGHKEAAGFEIDPSKIEEFKITFAKILDESIDGKELTPILTIDLELKREQVTMELAKAINQLAPFGQGNPVPIFSTRELSVIDFRKLTDGKHLKLTLTDGVNMINGIAFGRGDLYDLLLSGQKLELAFALDINEWQGTRSLQLNIKDIRPLKE